MPDLKHSGTNLLSADRVVQLAMKRIIAEGAQHQVAAVSRPLHQLCKMENKGGFQLVFILLGLGPGESAADEQQTCQKKNVMRSMGAMHNLIASLRFMVDGSL